MGSFYHVRLADSPLTRSQLEALQKAVQERLDEVNRQMSHYRPDSELSRFNAHASTAPFKVSAEFARVTRMALELHAQSGGAFDPTLGPLINLWGFGQQGETQKAPSKEEVEKTLRITGCRHLRVTDRDELQKDLPELQLNLSAVAKGFGVDEAARIIRARGVRNLMVEIGGEVVAFGHNPRGRPWRIGIDEPVAGALPGEFLRQALSLSDQAVATSGDYRKFFADADGRRYSHILDPATGYPTRHELASVTVVADTCLRADGLATTLFALGPEHGLAFIEKQTNASAFFMVRETNGGFRRFASSRFPRLEKVE